MEEVDENFRRSPDFQKFMDKKCEEIRNEFPDKKKRYVSLMARKEYQDIKRRQYAKDNAYMKKCNHIEEEESKIKMCLSCGKEHFSTGEYCHICKAKGNVYENK